MKQALMAVMYFTVAALLLLPSRAHAATTTLGISTQPRCTLTGQPIAPGVVVEVLSDGALDKNFTGTVTASKATGTGTLSGTLSATAVAGVATFTNLRITGSGAHTLRFTAAGSTVDSVSFAIREAPYTTRGAILPEHQITDSVHSVTTRYKIFVPSSNVVGTTPTAANPVPLIIYGHPFGSYTDPQIMIGGEFGKRVNENANTYPFFVVFPAIAANTELDKAGWHVVLPEIVARMRADGYHIDMTRIYYYGYSTGAIHMPNLVVRHPTFWAALLANDGSFTSIQMTRSGVGPPLGHLPGHFYDPTGVDTATFAEVGRIMAESNVALAYYDSREGNWNNAGRDTSDVRPLLDIIDSQVTAKFERSHGSFTTVPATTNPRVYRHYTNLDHGMIQSTVPSSTNWPLIEAWFLAQRRAPTSAAIFTAQPRGTGVVVGQTASFSVTAGGTPSPSFQWQKSTNNGATWVSIVGATGTTYTTPATVLADNNTLFRCVATNSAGIVNSVAATLTVSATPVAPVFTAQPADRAVVAGQGAQFYALATGIPAPAFQWQKSLDGGATWVDVSGATAVSYSAPATVLSDNDTRFRCIATNAGGTARSNIVTLTVVSTGVAPAFTAHPQNKSVTAGQTATFTAVATGSPTPNLLWQKSTDGGVTWMGILGATGATYTTPPTAAGDNNSWFRCIASNSVYFALSNAAVLTVTGGTVAPAFTTQPQNKSVNVGQTAQFSVVVTGAPAPTLQWQKSTDGGVTWVSIAGATAATYTTPATVIGDNGARFRCVATNSAGTVNSTSATLTVTVATVPASFTTQPQDKSVNVGQTAQFTVVASGTPAPTLQWQKSTDGGVTWVSITGATAATYTTPATVLGDNGAKFRCVATNSAGTANSTSATLTVTVATVPPSFTTQPQDKSVNVGQTAQFTVVLSGTPAPTLQWQKSTDGGMTWVSIAGATAATYTTPATVIGDNGAKFRCVATNSAGQATSSAATLLVARVNTPPSIQSPASANPNPVSAGQSATFSVAATDVDGDSLLYTWNFGDGNAQSGASVVHAYAAPGTYTARVTISDESTSIQSSVVVTVTVATDPRLIAHWKLNEATGTRASDSSGNDNHGTLVNGPVWSPGRLEGGLKCDGINDFVESPNKPSLNPAAQLTLSAWVNMAELNATSKAVIAKTSSLGAQYCLVILPKGRLRATVANSGVSGVTVLAPGRWYHLAVTYDGVALKLYVNGVLDSSVAKSGAMTDCGANVRVGQGTGTESLYFSGTLDDVRIYNQALTAGEINGLAFPAAAAASAVPVIIDLGTYSTGERLKLKLPLPETLTSSRKRFKLADGSLPRGLRHSNGRLSGVPSEKGTFQFTLSVSARGQSLLQAYVITIRTQE